MKRRTRKQWYEYHINNAKEEEKSFVYRKYADVIDAHERILNEARERLAQAKMAAPLLARVSKFFGADTEYYKINVRPCESDLLVAVRALQDVYSRQTQELEEAEKRGAENYLAARQARKEEAEARAERAMQRKHQRRVRYLEESPALRSAARVLKQLLIQEHAQGGEWINCFYCNCRIPASESHLEHKRPISRGGTNSKGNLALSCAACNLKKGRKTHDEFMRSFRSAP
jgi:5-methylcytosine-specific restriction endonuclease McrA